MNRTANSLAHRQPRVTRARCTDAGSVSVEAAVLVPVIVLVGLLVIVAARLASAQQSVDNAATAAARAASLARTPGAAQHAGDTVARARLGREGITCRATRVRVDASQIAPGRAGSVQARVSCQVPLADLAMPAPGTHTVTSDFSSTTDPYRGIP